MTALLGFVGGFYESRSLNFDAQRCVNLYPEISGSGSSKSPAMLVGTPGLKLWLDGLAGPIRAMLVFDEQTLIVVAGYMVYNISPTGNAYAINSISTGEGPAYMSSNGKDVFLVASGIPYKLLNPSTGFGTLVPIIGLPAQPDMVTFLDGAFIYNEPGTGRFWGSDLYSFTVNPLSFATAEGSPDQLIGLLTDHRELWLFGSRTTEVWYNNGATLGFPYARIDGAFLEMGCIAKNTILKANNSVYWLSADADGQGMVMEATGFKPARISTHAIERKIAEMPDVTDATAFTYQQEGHIFYQINFPSGNMTFVFDMSTRTWHERAWMDDKGVLNRHRAAEAVYFGRKTLVGDWETGKIYEYSLDHYSDDGQEILRLRRTNHIAQGMEEFGHMSLVVDIETGVGNFVGQGRNPKLLMRYSDDGGHQWSNQREAFIGQGGRYRQRVKYLRLGRSRDRVYEIAISDPVKVMMLGAYLNES